MRGVLCGVGLLGMAAGCGSTGEVWTVDRIEEGRPVVLDSAGGRVEADRLLRLPALSEGDVLVDGAVSAAERERRILAIRDARARVTADEGGDFSLASPGAPAAPALRGAGR